MTNYQNMKPTIFKITTLVTVLFFTAQLSAQKFQGKAYYFSKSKMELGNWGARMSEAQKKQIQARLKNRLEKKYILSFNMQESTFLEEEKIDDISGATDSWGGYFSRGDLHKNIKENKLVQSQEFYGKRFLVKDELIKIDWNLGTETKMIGNYTCYKAAAMVPKSELSWFDFSWSDLRSNSEDGKKIEEPMLVVEAWYTLQIPVPQGPAEYWGLPGLILEVSSGNTTLLCSELVLNPTEKIKIEAPDKGEEITKKEYTSTIRKKMVDMRNNRMGRRRGR